MDAYRFYVPSLAAQAAQGAAITLPDDQSHHARAVLRLGGGERVVLFDGAGTWAEGTVRGPVDKRQALVVMVGAAGVQTDPLPAIRLTLATAVPKGERAEWLVEQASQLNVARVQWLDCERSVVKPREGGGKIEKWRRLAVESAKQCGRTHVMAVEEMVDLAGVMEAARTGEKRVLWLEPRAAGGIAEALREAGQKGAEIIALVGPEGGWSPGETARLEGWVREGRVVPVRLTETVLRIETACAAIGAIVMGGG